jgi:hypothetical protein
MQKQITRNKIEWTNSSRRIATEVISINQESTIAYIEAMAAELSTMAMKSDQKFIGYLLRLVSAEAKSATQNPQLNGS